jgi:hypothetical protein
MTDAQGMLLCMVFVTVCSGLTSAMPCEDRIAVNIFRHILSVTVQKGITRENDLTAFDPVAYNRPMQ